MGARRLWGFCLGSPQVQLDSSILASHIESRAIAWAKQEFQPLGFHGLIESKPLNQPPMKPTLSGVLSILAISTAIAGIAHAQLAPGLSLNFDANDPASGVDSGNWNSLTTDSSKDLDFGADVTLVDVTTSFAGINKAYRFDGTGTADSDNPTWDNQYGDGSGSSATATTWELWIKPADTGDADAQCITESGGSGTGYAIWYDKGTDADGSGTINFTIDGGNGAQIETVRAVIDTSEFRHVTCVYERDGAAGGIDVMQIWVDGVLIDDNLSANPDADATNDNDNLDIPDWSGSNGSGFGDANDSFADNLPNGEFEGDVSVFRVWGGKALGGKEIIGNFNAMVGSFSVDAGTDTDGDEFWEDIASGNPSGLGLLLDDSPAVVREVILGSNTLLSHAYDFVGGSTENEAGALLVTSDTTTAQSFQNAPGDWSNNAVSLEVWFKPDDLLAGDSPANGQIIFEDGGGIGLGLFIDNNSLVCGQDSNSPLITYDLVTDGLDVIDDTTTPTSEFIQAVVTRTQTGATTFYINGTDVGSTTDDNDWSGGDPAGFGTRGGVNTGGRGNNQASTESFDGQIALVRLYNDLVLTAGQVQATYDRLTAPDTLAPEVVTLSPVDDDPAVILNGDLVIEFTEAIQVGTGEIRIVNETDVVTTTIDVITDASQIAVSGATLTVTPAVALIGGKDYHIEIDETVIEDESGNAFAGIFDADTWNFSVEGIPPTLDSFANDKPGGQVFDNDSVTYTLSFSEDLNATTVDAGDFSNNGSAGITVDSVTPVSGSVYEVVVSPTSTGTIQLQVTSLTNIEDLSGNELDTSSAILDPTVIDVLAFVANSGSLVLDFQETLASEEFDTIAAGDNLWGDTTPAEFYHVSVNSNNAGYGSYIALDASDSAIPPYTRPFNGPILGWAFYGGSPDDVLGFSEESGGLISYTTTDTEFDSFGQDQLKFWNATDPGANLNLPADETAEGTTTQDKNVAGYRSFNQVSGTIDISGLASGTAYIFYGDFNNTPSVNVIMRDIDGLHPDVVLGDVHSIGVGGNGRPANRCEFFVAEVSFVTDGGLYEEILYDYSGGDAGRAGGVVLTGITPAPLVKDNDTDDLNLGSSWVGGVAPGPIDTGLWNNTVTGNNSTVLGADLEWNAIRVEDPAGDVTIGGGNNLTLNGFGSTGTAIDMSSATVDLTIDSGLTMTDGDTWSVASGRTLSIGGVISGDSGITLTGDGTAILLGANTFGGDTTITSGTLQLGAADVIPNGSGGGDLSVTGTLDLNGNSDTVNGLLGSGVIDNTAGSTSATLSVGDDDRSTTFAGTLQNSGAIAALGLQKIGGGSLTLSGANTHSGGTILSSGTVIFDSLIAPGSGTITFDNGGLAPTAAVFSIDGIYSNSVTVAGGSTELNTIQSTNGTGSVIFDGAVTVNGGTTLTLDNSGSTLDMTGLISGAGGLATTGASTENFIFRGANTYSGGTLLGGSGVFIPTVSSTGPAGSPTSGPFGTGALTIGSVAMRSTNTADTSIGNPVVLAGGLTGITATGEKNLIFTGPVTLTGSRTINSAIGQTVGTSSLVFAGDIDDGASTFGLTKEGGGVLVLGGTNTFGGNLSIGNGTVRVASAASAGNGGQIISNSFNANNVTFASADATPLTFTKTVSTNAAGGGITFGDAIGTGDLTFTGDLTRAGGATNRTTVVAGSTTVTFEGNLLSPSADNANTTFTKAGTGTLVFKGTGGATDAFSKIQVTGGALAATRLADLGVPSSIGAAVKATPGAVSITLDDAELLYIDGGGAASSTNRLLQIGRTTDAVSGAIRNNATNPAETVTFSNTDPIAYGTIDQARTLVLGGTNTGANTFASEIGDNGTAAVALTKEDPGTWVLSGANPYTGNTSVSEGTLGLDGASLASAVTVAGGASLEFTLGSPSSTTSTLDLGTGTVKIVGAVDNVSDYQLMTATGGISGGLTLDTPIPDYELELRNGDTELWLSFVGTGGYAAWAAANAPTDADPTLDEDGDGVTNGVEYVLGGLISTNDLDKLPTLGTPGDDLTFTFVRDQSSIDGSTTVEIEVGTTLASWPDVYAVPDAAAANNPGVSVTKDSPSVGFDTVTLTIARAPDTKKFARLKVTVPTP